MKLSIVKQRYPLISDCKPQKNLDVSFDGGFLEEEGRSNGNGVYTKSVEKQSM
jgi:hypothetical protein